MNQNIKEACKQYITQEVNPEYGIMLNGPWGCGKTFFIDELQKEPWLKNIEGEKEKKVVKISLYGVTSKEDIETQLFYAAHDKLNNNFLKDAGSLISTFLGGSCNVDSKTAMSICFKNWSKMVKVIIVDDLERSSMAVHEIMGYFYNYIVTQGIRIIFIGNEDEIKDNEGKKDRQFERTKEKVIGETYTLQPQIKDAVMAFLAKKIDIKIPHDRAIQICLKVVEKLEIINLRTIWQGLVRVQRLINAIVECEAFQDVKYSNEEYSKDDHTKEDYLSEILELYLVLYMQMTTGDVTKENNNGINEDYNLPNQSNIMEAIGVYQNQSCSLLTLNKREEQEDKNKIQGSQPKVEMSLIKGLRRIPSGFLALSSSKYKYKIWSDFLFESIINKELLNMVIEENQEWFTPKKDIKSNLYKLISDSLAMEEEEFNTCYNTVIDEFMNGKYVHAGELMHGYALCLTYQEFDVRSYAEGEIATLFDNILSKTDLKAESKDTYWSVYDQSSMGYQYSKDMQTGEGKVFADKLRTQINVKITDMNKKEFIHEFESITTSHQLSEWINLLNVNNSNRNYSSYYEKPILSWLGSKRIFAKLITLSYGNQLNFINALKHRYEMRYSNGEFKHVHFSDFNILVEIEKEYNTHIDNIGVGNIQNYRLKLILRNLNELIQYCKSFIDANDKK